MLNSREKKILWVQKGKIIDCAKFLLNLTLFDFISLFNKELS